MVARENFGPRVAQVAAVALLIDYVVTVAVQTAAGSAAIVSAFLALSHLPVIGPRILLVTSVTATGLMCLGNLRGLREAGRVFALPTYLFAGSLLVMIVIGLVRELAGGGLPHVVAGAGTVGIGSHSRLIAIGAVGGPRACARNGLDPCLHACAAQPRGDVGCFAARRSPGVVFLTTPGVVATVSP